MAASYWVNEAFFGLFVFTDSCWTENYASDKSFRIVAYQ